MDMIWMVTPDSFTLLIHKLRSGSPFAKRKITNEIMTGSRKPDIIPVDSLSYFSVRVISEFLFKIIDIPVSGHID